ncbi:three-Cys-motif partner protein TcmP [Ferrimicrobium sp.]|uniref:three-Cys-motif partner protein TcmP n=1 Tax=Ferrimicrobium sp. TaxID=2926050 RepID=UPI00260881EF|nr:three-Cys-motif partner protein TcmP [Ferrimicrobium sp.]
MSGEPGFAGPGRYAGGEDGSPLLALKSLIGHKSFAAWHSTQFKFIFIESDRTECEQLKEELRDYFSSVSRPPNVCYKSYQGDFSELISRLRATGVVAKDSPLLAFVDPFGYGAVPMDVIAPMVRPRWSEILINLSTDPINRFFEQGSVEVALNRLFGLTTEARIKNFPSDDRAGAIARLYIDRLSDEAEFGFTREFVMEFPPGHVGYHLVVGSHSIDGLEAVKAAMWKVDPSGAFRFADHLAGQRFLFTGDNIDFEPLRAALIQQFGGRTVSIEEIIDFVVLETPFLRTHVKTRVLVPMQRAGQIVGVNQSKRNQYPNGTTVRFC